MTLLRGQTKKTLTPEQRRRIVELKTQYQLTHEVIAKRFGISKRTIEAIVREERKKSRRN